MRCCNIASAAALALAAVILAGCSVTKYLPDESYLLDKVEVRCDDKELAASGLEQYIRQKGNSKWFSLFSIPLGAYALAGTDTTKWINRTLRNMGEEPVLYDTLQARLTCDDLQQAVRDMGYIHATVDTETKLRGKKVKVVYKISPGQPYTIAQVAYDIEDDSIRAAAGPLLARSMLTPGARLSLDRLDGERKRITGLLNDNGYYRFNKDFISYTVDTTLNSKDVDVTLHIAPYNSSDGTSTTLHPRYSVASISYNNDNTTTPLRQSVLQENTWIREGEPYSASDVQRTYNRLGRLAAVSYTNIRFDEQPDTTLLDCTIQVGTGKPHSISLQPEGTNTSGNLGAAASLTYENRNIFHGSETFSINLRAAFEAITGLEGYQNDDYEEYSAEMKLTFPTMLLPFSSNRFRKNHQATSELAVSYNMQNRPEFHRRVFTAAWRYRWSNRNRRTSWRIDALDIDYISMPWISQTFKEEYLDSVSNRNAILKYNYEDLFIVKIGGSMTYNDGTNAVKVSVEAAGNVLYGLNNAFGGSRNSDGQYTLFNIAYAQYAKFDIDYTRLIRLSNKDALAAHIGLGVAYPYGNSDMLPFEKRYFSGGANSVRGWSVRGLGPGKFRGSDGRIDFINQTGDVKLDLNIEYRAFLFWKFFGAAFIDAGNIWTLRNYEDQPGGQFKWNSFYEQIAVSYGLGLRLNFDYFILRFDMGMKAITPGYETQQEHYALFNPDISRDFTFHFAVGLPF